MKFSGVITNDKGDVHAKGHRSKVKITEVKTNFAPNLVISGPLLRFEFTDGHEITLIAWSGSVWWCLEIFHELLNLVYNNS